MNSKFNKTEIFIFGLLFVLLAVFLVHNFDSIGQDIGRHLKTGEIIWQTKEVPKTNLFSFTEPEFPFINHHWLSEVIFYGVFSWFGFSGLILLKTFFILLSFFVLFRIFRIRFDLETEKGRTLGIGFWPVLISFLLSLFIFISRTEARPEIFSFVILSLFLLTLFRIKYSSMPDLKNLQGPPVGEAGRTLSYLWLLPVLELFWVNLHIYFFIGPLIFLFFLIDRVIGDANNANNMRMMRTRYFIIFTLIILATLVNPAGIQGALLPFNILKEYGYSIVENQSLSFLADFFGFNLSIFVFKLSAAVLAVSFVLIVKKTKHRIFEILISAFFIYAGFKMLRNLPLYALASFPVLAILLNDTRCQYANFMRISRIANNILKSATAAFLVFMIFFVASGGYYKKAGLSKAFGFSVPNGLERAVDFVKENNIKGPIFNNFDIGGYLIWRLPEEKVFVDNRPESYSVEFFSEVYKPMQENKEKWKEFSEKYNINFVFFDHTDATPWGRSFLGSIIRNPDWKAVYINENAIVLVKNDQRNADAVYRFSISEKNAVAAVVENIKESNTDKVNLGLAISLFFYNIGWREASVYFANEAIKSDPKNPRPYLYKGLAHAYYTDENNQKLAGENIKKAIELGLKESRYYYILGVVYMNLGRLDEARLLFEKALELDENNVQAQEFLNKYFNK